MAGGRPREDGDAWTAELRQLAHDVREATDRVQKLTSEIEGDVAAATRRMQEVRERTRARLADLQAAPPPPPPAAEPAGLLRLSERLREMVQDAARKGERLSETGEQASRAAERLVRHLEDARHDMDGLAVRLAPAGGADAARADAPAPAPDLRLLDAEGGDAATDPREADRP
jgi:chromosome segregation ATPase